MESFFSSLKTERVRQKIFGTKKQARADVFDYIERFYTPKRRHSTIGYLSPITFEERAMKAKVAVRETGSRPVVKIHRWVHNKMDSSKTKKKLEMYLRIECGRAWVCKFLT